MHTVEGVVLAAGFSSRMGSFKPILKMGNKTIIERCIDDMYEVCSRIIVVGGYKLDLLYGALRSYKNVELVYNENFKDGMFSSVKVGLNQVKEERFFITPGDYPFIGKNIYEDLLKCQADIVAPVYKGTRGHPLLIKSNLIKEVFNNERYTNMRDFINIKGYKALEVQDEGILMDLDTIEDYKYICALKKGIISEKN